MGGGGGDKNHGGRTTEPTVGCHAQIRHHYAAAVDSLAVTWDMPIETAGKRGKRIEQANHLSEAAHWDFVGAAWKTRSNVRAALLDIYAARENESQLARQEAAQSNVLRLLEGQLAAGAVSSYEVTQARVTLTTTRLARQDATGQSAQARVQLAGALGLPLRALDGVKFSFAGWNEFPQRVDRVRSPPRGDFESRRRARCAGRICRQPVRAPA